MHHEIERLHLDPVLIHLGSREQTGIGCHAAAHAAAHATVIHRGAPGVKVDDAVHGIQRFEKAVVTEGFHEIGIRAKIDVAQRGRFELAHLWFVDRGCITGALEIIAKAIIDPVFAVQVDARWHGVVGVVRVLGNAKIVVAEVGEQGMTSIC